MTNTATRQTAPTKTTAVIAHQPKKKKELTLLKDMGTAKPMERAVVAGLYSRLSVDDPYIEESGSIQTQKALLEDYCEQKNFTVFDHYVDDGVSGTSFQRPGFLRMLADIDAGKINTVICKDLSRFGRNYVEAGMYIENLFVEKNVRFIAPGDNVDTARKGFDLSIAFRNLMNDMYARDSSEKTKKALITRAKQGMFLASKAPYGYMKDPEDSHHLVIDEEAAQVVRRIFDMAYTGSGYNRIAKTLHDDGVLIPSSYYAKKCPEYFKVNPPEESTRWHVTSVQTIMQNPVYMGLLAQHRRGAKTMKGKQEKKPAEEWIVVDGTHDALVSQEVWESVQEQVTIRRRAQKTGQPQMFAGLLYCADCGSALSFSAKRRKTMPDGGEYKCWMYMRHGKKVCSSHYISLDQLNEILLPIIRRQAYYASRHTKLYVEMVADVLREKDEQALKAAGKDIAKLKKRDAELDAIIKKLFEQNAAGTLTNERFASMLTEYENEHTAIKEQLAEAGAVLDEENDHKQNAIEFANTVQRYIDVEVLDAKLLNTLIHRILVHQRENGENRDFTQQVDIYFKFIGMTFIEFDDILADYSRKHE